MNFLETCEGSPVDGMESVPGAVATGSKPTAIIEIAGNVTPVAIALGTDLILT